MCANPSTNKKNIENISLVEKIQNMVRNSPSSPQLVFSTNRGEEIYFYRA